MDRPRDPEADYRARRGAQPIDSDDDADSDDTADSGTEYAVRTDAVRSMDADDTTNVNRESGGSGAEEADGENAIRDEPITNFEGASRPDPLLAEPGALPESVEVTSVAPDGTAIDSGLTDPTGAAIGGSTLRDAIAGRGAELGGGIGGSRLDPLGMLDSSGVDEPSDREIDQAISQADGSEVGWKFKLDTPFLYVDIDTDRQTDSTETPPQRPTQEPKLYADDEDEALETGLPVRPVDPDEADEEKPAPDDTGYDVVTASNVDEALRTRGTAPYERPSDQDDDSNTVTDVNLAWAAAGDDPRLTQYGPDGPQAVPGDATVTPPTDHVIDPPQEGSAAFTGDASGAAAAGTVSLAGEGATERKITGLNAPAPSGGDALATKYDVNGATVDMSSGQMVGSMVPDKADVNGVSVDMVTGQVIGSAAPTMGGELDAAGGAVSQGDEDDGEGDGGVQSLTAGSAAPVSGASLAAAGTASAAGGVVSQGDEGDADDGAAQSFVAEDAALAVGAPDAGLGGADAPGTLGDVDGAVSPDAAASGTPPGDEG